MNQDPARASADALLPVPVERIDPEIAIYRMPEVFNRVYLQIGAIGVYVCQNDEGVSVDLMPHIDGEINLDQSQYSTCMFYAEAENDEETA
jgi:hypothetical protein